MAEDQAAEAAQEEQVQQQFTMQRIYTKDVSFESPASPDIFRQNWQPSVNVDLNTRSSKADDAGNHEVILTITVTAKIEDKNAFLVEVQQAGIFFAAGIDEEPLKQLLATVAPNILFPYAREAIDAMVIKGGFPPLMLAPVNFDALYHQAMAQSGSTESGEQRADGSTH
ncbi:MAG: protein-export chaperone SecB [Pseudomonadota bacterium]|nr:protein-export chaperone SecB [Pseudomonadota bacterium]